MRIQQDYTQELIEALNVVYPLRDKIEKTLLETHDENLLDKLIHINKMIENAEIILQKKQDIKSFYAKNYPEYVDENNEINETGIQRMEMLKTKWEILGYLKKNN